ncbi:hypothetical protein J437_LFUL005529, partial [Ladona fulva]
LGFSFGIGLTYPLCGFLIANFGWRVVFYVTGSIGVLWCGIWWLLAFDSPASHPRISQAELLYIESHVGNTVVGDKGMATPWKSIITSAPVWAIAITTFGRIWVHYTFIIPGPMYMKTVLGFSIQKWKSEAQVVPGLLVLLIGYLGCDIVLVVVIWFIAVTLITASYAGAMASIVDIAPNLAAAVAVATYIVFQIFGTADIQKWNYPNEVPPAKEALTKNMIPIISSKIHDSDEEVVTIAEEQQSLQPPDNKRDVEGA